MTIKCVQSGTELADYMKVCYNCGKPQQVMVGASVPQWITVKLSMNSLVCWG